MKIPPADPQVSALFDELVRSEPRLIARRMFGQPAGFLHGHLCVGVFGSELFFRLGPDDRKQASTLPGARPFEPMPGRPMREYVVLPPSIVSEPREARRWLGRSVAFASGLPPKGPGPASGRKPARSRSTKA